MKEVVMGIVFVIISHFEAFCQSGSTKHCVRIFLQTSIPFSQSVDVVDRVLKKMSEQAVADEVFLFKVSEAYCRRYCPALKVV